MILPRATQPALEDPDAEAIKRQEHRLDLQRKYRGQNREILHHFKFGFDKRGCPKPANTKELNQYRTDLGGFMPHAFPRTFYKEHSAGQLDDIALMQTVIIKGGQFAFASPRGDGKTSRIIAAVIWAVSYGYHPCVAIIGSEQDAADQILDSIKMEFRVNDVLYRMFPEICVPVRVADDKAIVAKTLTFRRKDMHFKWGQKLLALPTIEGIASSGAIIIPRGLTGRIRGMVFKHPDGRSVRPSLLIPDDPQTDKSAKSPTECENRERLVTAAILGTAGHGKPPTALMPCTVIRRGDMSDSILDNKIHPEWHGRKRGMIQKWPDEWEKEERGLWGKYIEMRKDEHREEVEAGTAEAFYAENREAMDAGAETDWVLDPEAPAASSLQYAINLWCDRGEATFMAEFQNDPVKDELSIYEISPSLVITRLNGRKRGVVTAGHDILTAFTDINHYGLHWCVAAFQSDMTACVVDYGRFPSDPRAVIVPAKASEHDRNQLIYGALVEWGELMAQKTYMRGDEPARMNLLLVDRGYAGKVVHQFVNNAKLPFDVMPSLGFAATRYRPFKNATVGKPLEECHVTRTDMGITMAHNADYWREVMQKAFLPKPGSPGGCTLFGKRERSHDEFAKQICAEVLIEKVQGETELFYKWAHKPGQLWDWGDALTGCYVAAARFGLSATGTPLPKKKRKKGWKIRR